MNFELFAGSKSLPFVPSQALEYWLGFDAAGTPPNSHPVWGIIRSSIPSGMKLIGIWPHLGIQLAPPRIGGRFVSLFLQYKIPDHKSTKRARYWDDFGAPYFEVNLNTMQRDRLIDLEKSTSQNAVVRYAAPLCWRYSDLFSIAQANQLVANSVFAPPAASIGHTRWIYDRQKSAFNPEPKFTTAERWLDLAANLTNAPSRTKSITEHITVLAEACRTMQTESSDQVVDRLQALIESEASSDQSARWYADLATIAIAAASAQADWVVVVL